MTLGLLFWLLMFLWLFFSFPNNAFIGTYGPWGSWIFGILLFALLGWRVFGPAITG